MTMRVWRIGILCLGFAFASAARAEETVAEVSKKIAAASEKLNSFSAKAKTVTEMKQEGFSMLSTIDGTTELLRKGSDFLVRSESKSVAETNVGGQTTKQESSVLVIGDGSYMYTLSDSAGTKSAYKSKIEKPDVDPFKVWRDTADLKVLPDASVDGRAVWVIEATPKKDQVGQGKTVISYDKESGQVIKLVSNTPDGKPMTTMTCSNIKVNEKIGADRFVFTPPPGVTVQDMSP